jgi:hypothetical protein
MKKQLWIFGDSYVDVSFPNNSSAYKRWWEYLEEDFIIHNFGITGSGPRDALTRLYRIMQWQTNTNEISILFVLSDIERVSFCNLPAERQHQLSLHGKVSGDIENKVSKTMKELKPLYYSMIKHFFSTDSWTTELFSIVNTLMVLSKHFEKIIVFQAFGHPLIANDLKAGFKNNLKILNEESLNWKFVDTPLAQLSIENCMDMNEQVLTDVDHRLNHFGQEISAELGKQTLKCFRNKKFDISKLTKSKNNYNYSKSRYWNYNE